MYYFYSTRDGGGGNKPDIQRSKAVAHLSQQTQLSFVLTTTLFLARTVSIQLTILPSSLELCVNRSTAIPKQPHAQVRP